MKLMKKSILCVLLALFSVAALSAKETTLSRRNVSSSSLKNFVDSEYVEELEVDEDGDLFIRYNGVNGYILVVDNLSLVRFLAGWTADSDLPEQDALRIVNDWNKDQMFAYAYYINGKFRLDYYLPYEGGLSSTNFNTSLDMFFDQADMFWDFLLEEDAL